MAATIMRRATALLLTLSIGLAAPTPAAAAIVIGTGSYQAGDFLDVVAPYSAPRDGTYRFAIDLSTPVDLTAFTLQTVTTTMFYDFHDGQGFQYVGGDDAPGGVTFQQVTPVQYVALLSTTAFTSTTTYGNPLTGEPDVMINTIEDCCRVEIDGGVAAADGTYTISVSPVAEPGAWALMIIGFGTVGAGLRSSARRRIRATAA